MSFHKHWKIIGVFLKELFEDIGAIRTARVHFDENGQSLGTAEVIFERRVDAANAQQKYNGLNLDGKTSFKRQRKCSSNAMIRSSYGYSISRWSR